MNIQLVLKDENVLIALNKAKSLGLSFDQFVNNAILEALSVGSPQKNISLGVDDLIKEILHSAEKLAIGEKFHSASFFSKEYWNSISVGDRKSIGKLLKVKIENCNFAEYVDRNSANKAIYVKL